MGVEGGKGRSPQRMEGACVLRRRYKGLGIEEGRGGSGQAGRRTRIGPSVPRLLLCSPLLHLLSGSAAALAPTSGHPLWQAPPPAGSAPGSPPRLPLVVATGCSAGGGGFGTRSRERRVVPRGGGQAMIAGPWRPARANQSPRLSFCLSPSGLLSPAPLRGLQRRPRRAPSDGGGDSAQASNPQADPATAGRGVPGGGEYGRDRSQGGGRHQCLGGQVRTSASRPRRGAGRAGDPRTRVGCCISTSAQV